MARRAGRSAIALLVRARERQDRYRTGATIGLGFARAVSEAGIVKAFPQLKALHETPAWMTKERE